MVFALPKQDGMASMITPPTIFGFRQGSRPRVKLAPDPGAGWGWLLKIPTFPEGGLGQWPRRVKMARRLWLLFAPLVWPFLVQGQNYDEYDNWCEGWGASSVMVGNKIYYDYALVWLRIENPLNKTQMITANNPFLWVLDLTSNFNASKISSDFKLSSIPQLKGYRKGRDIPHTTEGIMWASRNGTIYEAGGFFPLQGPMQSPEQVTQIPITRERAVWSFNPTNEEWRHEETDGDEIDRVSAAAYVSAPDLDLHFAVGGVTTSQHQAENKDYPIWADSKVPGTVNNGITIYNSKTQSLRNRTLEDLAEVSDGMAARERGWCKYVPFGTNGTLVCHALHTGPDNGQLVKNVYDYKDPQLKTTSYHTVDLYDIGGDKWYIQSTSTNELDHPLYFLDGCAAIGSDGATWEIYMYGCSYLVYGNTEEYSSCQDIWVLTIPAFRWFRLPATRKPITGHGCHIVGKQLVTVAGLEFNRKIDQWDHREQTLCMNTPFRVYDLEMLEWTDNYIPSKYVPPMAVAGFVKDPKHDRPTSGWQNVDVERLFNATIGPSPTPSSPPFSGSSPPAESSPTPSRSPPPPPPPSKPKTPATAAIAGGTVGGLAALSGIVAVLWLVLRRRNKTPNHSPEPNWPPAPGFPAGYNWPVAEYPEMGQENYPANPYTGY